ncbi:MAG: HAD family hydrolase [Deltaproteobacteria bacterium]|nr:HAD family hydrolase [Deltaproteobacteria bacterium]
MGAARQAVFLDRDGVLNRALVRNGKPYPPTSLAELEILPGVPEALAALQGAGFLLIGVTNQPDVARGTQRREVVEAINAALLAALPVSEILVCYHDDRDECSCRKPQPGLLLQAAAKYDIALPLSFMIGDRWRDVEAGRHAGCRTLLLDYGYQEKGTEFPPDCISRSLPEAAAWILRHSVTGTGGG